MAEAKRSKAAHPRARTKSHKAPSLKQRLASRRPRTKFKEKAMLKDHPLTDFTHDTPAQEPIVGQIVPRAAVPDGQALLDQLSKFYSETWTVLNEMRLRNEIPAWVAANFKHLGTRGQMADFHALRNGIASALNGQPTAHNNDLTDVPFRVIPPRRRRRSH